MKLKNDYSANYENGRCPLGFEYVNAYYDSINRRHVDSYCRKIKKFRTDPTEKEQNHSDKIHARVDSDFVKAEQAYYDSDGMETGTAD